MPNSYHSTSVTNIDVQLAFKTNWELGVSDCHSDSPIMGRPDQMNGHSVWGLRFEWTAKWNVMANGHELWWRTATNFGSERPRTLAANGHELWWRTAKNFGGERPKINRRTATNFVCERPRFLMANGHPYIIDCIDISTTWIINFVKIYKPIYRLLFIYK